MCRRSTDCIISLTLDATERDALRAYVRARTSLSLTQWIRMAINDKLDRDHADISTLELRTLGRTPTPELY